MAEKPIEPPDLAARVPTRAGPSMNEWMDLRESLQTFDRHYRSRPHMYADLPLPPDFFTQPLPDLGLWGEWIRSARVKVCSNPAYAWLLQQAGFRKGFKSFHQRVSSSAHDMLYARFVVRHLVQLFQEQLRPGTWAEPTKAERQKAAKLAQRLLDVLDAHSVGFKLSSQQSHLEEVLTKFVVEQELHMRERKFKEDGTAPLRRFVIGLAVEIEKTCHKCVPSVLKPLGSIIGYEQDERGWARLAMEARTLVAGIEQKEQRDGATTRAAFKAAMQRRRDHGK